MEQLKEYALPWVTIIAATLVLGWWLSGKGLVNSTDPHSHQGGRIMFNLGGQRAIEDAIQKLASAAPGLGLPGKIGLSASAPATQAGEPLSIPWGDTGTKLIESGAIDPDKFEELYQGRGGLTEAERKLLYAADNGDVVMTAENSGFLLNLLWALGLANENPILTTGEMANPQFDTGSFASTGGWTLSKGNAMDHYSRYSIIPLTADQQKLVEKVSRNIYRPCCDNSTHFPDCNHGMAMLGLLQVLAKAGATEDDMYNAALVANSYWFPDTYEMIKEYGEQKGLTLSAKRMLSAEFSSASGFAKVQEALSGWNSSGSSCAA